MKALIYDAFQETPEIRQVPDPEPNPDGVVIRVKATGLCRSDWHGWMGHDPDISLPHVPGHELAGTVEAVGPEVRAFRAGDRVTLPFVCGCGHCRECASGNQQVCDKQSQPGFTHWGSFAEYVAVDYADTNLVKLPDDIEYATAAVLGCRFITSFRAIVAQGKVSGGQYVAVHGCGGVGLSAIMIAYALGAEVIAVDIRPAALELARELGAQHCLNARETTDIAGAIRYLSDGGVQVSLDALGSQETCFNSISGLRKRGKHIQAGLMTGNHKAPKVPMGRIIADELQILGTHGMQAHKYPEMLKMIQNGILEPQKLIQKRICLEEAARALPLMDSFDHPGVQIIDSF
ncbi:zinc-dependent alcohol dehydrogenase family protein [Robiginitalea sp. IMCC43444]|uniref:zinc-dependent alcohol dehydrogenase family protein n=1 Tax=Robiginitalea sp. IMCC43444 TaxID=3459121 RepID=UPI0040424A64